MATIKSQQTYGEPKGVLVQPPSGTKSIPPAPKASATLAPSATSAPAGMLSAGSSGANDWQSSFDSTRYLNDNPDVKSYVLANQGQFGANAEEAMKNGALAHYTKFGANESRPAYTTAGIAVPTTQPKPIQTPNVSAPTAPSPAVPAPTVPSVKAAPAPASSAVKPQASPSPAPAAIEAPSSLQAPAWLTGFDAAGYISRNPDVQSYILANPGQFGADKTGGVITNDVLRNGALAHYMNFGIYEGRDPFGNMGKFDAARYLKDNPDVRDYILANKDQFGAGGGPITEGVLRNGALAHYVKFGAAEGRPAYNIATAPAATPSAPPQAGTPAPTAPQAGTPAPAAPQAGTPAGTPAAPTAGTQTQPPGAPPAPGAVYGGPEGSYQANIDPRTMTVEGRLAGLLSSGNPLLDMAMTRAMQQSNARGLLNSSMASESGMAAMIQNAIPIASPDAQTYANTLLQNTLFANQAAQQNKDIASKTALTEQQGGIDLQKIAAQGQQDLLRTGAQGDVDLQKIAAQGRQNLLQTGAQGEIDLQKVAAQGQQNVAQTREQTAGQLQIDAQRAANDIALALQKGQIDTSLQLLKSDAEAMANAARNNAAAYQTYAQAITNINNNASLNAEAKNVAKRELGDSFLQYLRLSGAAAGDVDFQSLVDNIMDAPAPAAPPPPPPLAPRGVYEPGQEPSRGTEH